MKVRLYSTLDGSVVHMMPLLRKPWPSKVSPSVLGSSKGSWKDGASCMLKVTVCGVGTSLIQRMVSPTLMFAVSGKNCMPSLPASSIEPTMTSSSFVPSGRGVTAPPLAATAADTALIDAMFVSYSAAMRASTSAWVSTSSPSGTTLTVPVMPGWMGQEYR